MHAGMLYGRIQGQGQGHEPIQVSRIENLQSREVDRQSPTGLIFYTFLFLARKLLFSPVSVCLSVNRITKNTTDHIFVTFYGMVGRNPVGSILSDLYSRSRSLESKKSSSFFCI